MDVIKQINLGDEVVYTGKSNSWDYADPTEAQVLLKVNSKYTVCAVSRGDYSDHIQLLGEPEKWYPTAYFEPVNS